MLAPYALTALMHRPDRLIYRSSGMHLGGDPSLDDLQWSGRRWNGSQAYSDTKLHDVLLAFGVAWCWPDVLSNVVSTGWAPTRMGGRSAPGDDSGARQTGGYFYHRRPGDVPPAVQDPELQDRLLDYCRDLSGVALA